MRCSRFTHSQNTVVNKQDYVELGLSCVAIYKALKQGMDGRELDDLSETVREAIDKLKTWVEPAMDISCSSAHRDLDRRTVTDIHKDIEERSGLREGVEKRSVLQSAWQEVSGFLHSSSNKDAIAAWKEDLKGLLLFFNVCSAHSCLALANYSVLRPS